MEITDHSLGGRSGRKAPAFVDVSLDGEPAAQVTASGRCKPELLAACTGEPYEFGDTTALDPGHGAADLMPRRLRTQLLKIHAHRDRRGFCGRRSYHDARRIESGQRHRNEDVHVRVRW